jgi:YD repeat-containing protein
MAGNALAQLPPPPKEMVSDANGVDVRTGNVTFESRELDIGPEGELGLHLGRYLSEGITRDSFDSTYYETSLSTGQWSVAASFGQLGDNFGTFGTAAGAFYDSSGIPRYQHRSGALVTFGLFMWQQSNPFGDNSYDHYRLADTVTYPSGAKLQIHYKLIPGPLPGVRIQSVTNNAGYQVKFRYASNNTASGDWNKRIAAIAINMAAEYCDPEADECALSLPWPTATYSRWSEGTTGAFSVANASGEATTYRTTPGSSGSSPKFSIALPGSTAEVRKYTYSHLPSECTALPSTSYCSMGFDFRVAQFQNPEKTVAYSYNYNVGVFDQITSVDPGGVTSRYRSWGPHQPGMRSITDPIERTQSFEYDDNGLITKATWPEGNYTEWQRDSRGNVTQERAHAKGDSQILTQGQTFGACAMGVTTCSLPVSITDARLHTTDIRYNAHGQKIAEVGPPDENGVRPLTRWVYADRYAWIKTPGGALVQAATPVSILSQMTICRSTFNGNLTTPACGSQADEVVTTYEFATTPGPNALLPIGKAVSADGQVLRTCYGYDLRGNRIWERSPRANLASCQ